MESPRYRVKAWVRDADLESVLNEDGWEIQQMFRNSPNLAGEETTTVVQRRSAYLTAEEADRWKEIMSLPTTYANGCSVSGYEVP